MYDRGIGMEADMANHQRDIANRKMWDEIDVLGARSDIAAARRCLIAAGVCDPGSLEQKDCLESAAYFQSRGESMLRIHGLFA